MAKLGAVKSDEEVPKAIPNTVDPTVYDDSSAGYHVSDVWVNSSTDQTFICVDDTVNAAVWKKLTDQGGGTPSWGAITGTLSAQTDLAGVLNGKVANNDSRLSDARTPTVHSHAPSEVTGTAVITSDSRLSDARTPTAHSHSPSEITGTAVITNDSRLSDARTPTAHSQAISTVTNLQTSLDGKEAANVNIQTHVTSAHAPSNAQKNSDITKAEIEAKLTGEITSHTHAGGGANTSYAINVQALTSSPADGATVYFGVLPKAPVSAGATSKIYVRVAGVIKRVEIYVYSGTAGTNENWSLYIRKNNTADTLIATVAANTNERVFSNANLNISLVAGDYFEIKGVQPAWATNPLTTVYGGYVYIE